MEDAPIDPNLPATRQSKLPIVMRGAAAVGRLIGKGVFLSRRASELWAEHQGRLASIEAWKSIVVEESKIAAQTKTDLLKLAASATDPLQRAQTMATLESVDSRIHTVNIVALAYGHLEDALSKDANQKQGEKLGDQPNVSDHWLDTFLQFARIRNEPWRQNLLARALALESQFPNTVGPNVLWAIGQLSEEKFHCFAYLLDISVLAKGTTFVPLAPKIDIYLTEIPNCAVQGIKCYGNIVPAMLEAGLIHPIMDPLGSGVHKSFYAGDTATFRYGANVVDGTWETFTRVPAIVLTDVGEVLARLYDPKANEFGRQLFEAWLATLDELKITSRVTVTA